MSNVRYNIPVGSAEVLTGCKETDETWLGPFTEPKTIEWDAVAEGFVTIGPRTNLTKQSFDTKNSGRATIEVDEYVRIRRLSEKEYKVI